MINRPFHSHSKGSNESSRGSCESNLLPISVSDANSTEESVGRWEI